MFLEEAIALTKAITKIDRDGKTVRIEDTPEQRALAKHQREHLLDKDCWCQPQKSDYSAKDS